MSIIMSGVESYLHRFAKQTVASWLRGRVKVGANFKGLQPLTECVPIGAPQPMCGVYEEFPVLRNGCGTKRLCPDNDQSATKECDHLTAWHCYSETQVKPVVSVVRKHGIPTIKALSAGGCHVASVFDVAVVNASGELCCVVEICHTNPMDDRKIAWLNEHNIPWFELSADWVMKQTRSPFSVQEGVLRSNRV